MSNTTRRKPVKNSAIENRRRAARMVAIPIHAVKVKLSTRGVATYGKMSRRCDHAFVVDVGRNNPHCLILLVPGYCREHGRIVMHRSMVVPWDRVEVNDLAAQDALRITQGTTENLPQRSVYMNGVSA